MLSSRSGLRCCRWVSLASRGSRPGVLRQVRPLSVTRSSLGEQLHGVRDSVASLPPDSCKEATVTPVPEEDREPLPASASPRDVYDWRVKYHDLSSDPHQENVIEYFMALHAALEIYRPASPSLLSMLFASPTSRRWGGGGRSKVPRGVYVWGTVGGGKTMLMDMFYDTLAGLSGDIKCRRVHYHDFMQDVHRRIHEAKKLAPPRDVSRWDTYQPFDPVPPVGDSIIAESWVICLDEFQVTDIADAMILKQLFAYLFDKGIILIATSNRPPKDLYKNGIQRSNFLPFIDMLTEKCGIGELNTQF